jgi:7,8-dihydropterin-6-yl-methyl-4-(beta-D-ribofuranosyl)aminobenzene 5'-phosphate synthase
VVNVMMHARDCFPHAALHGVIGGFHLSGGNEKIIPETVAALGQFDLKVVAPAHCTGWRAVSAMASRFGDALAPAAVGKTYRF